MLGAECAAGGEHCGWRCSDVVGLWRCPERKFGVCMRQCAGRASLSRRASAVGWGRIGRSQSRTLRYVTSGVGRPDIVALIFGAGACEVAQPATGTADVKRPWDRLGLRRYGKGTVREPLLTINERQLSRLQEITDRAQHNHLKLV